MNLTLELARALGMPPDCRKLVLTLETGEVPRILYECDVIERKPPTVFDLLADPPRQINPVRIRQLQFMVRLEPFTP